MRIYCCFILFFVPLSLSAQDTMKHYMFGHSLMDHRPPINPTPSDETTIAHWISVISNAADQPYAATGQFGFLESHRRDLPPISQWGYDSVPAVWDSESTPYADVNFEKVFITPRNFTQDEPPTAVYFGDTQSPIDNTSGIIDWIEGEEPGTEFYLYEHWPDMAPYLSNGFPPSQQEWDNYNDYLNGDYHDWFLEYHDSLLLRYPDQCVAMMNIGPAISDLLYTAPFDTIPIDSLYEDDAPHGRPSIYFLAGLASYMSMYEEQAPAGYVVPTTVHITIRENYQEAVNILWDALNNFTQDDGSTRVFCSQLVLPVQFLSFTGEKINNHIQLLFTTTEEVQNVGFEIQRSHNGRDWSVLDFIPASSSDEKIKTYKLIDTKPLAGVNYYRLKQLDRDGQHTFTRIVTVSFQTLHHDPWYPTITSGLLRSQEIIPGVVTVIGSEGTIHAQFKNVQTLDLSTVPDGLYILRMEHNGMMRQQRILKCSGG